VLVWTTGVTPHSLAAVGLPVDDRGRVTCDEYLARGIADAPFYVEGLLVQLPRFTWPPLVRLKSRQ
jgi:NADH dehydrogenase FAD-containing subunit